MLKSAGVVGLGEYVFSVRGPKIMAGSGKQSLTLAGGSAIQARILSALATERQWREWPSPLPDPPCRFGAARRMRAFVGKGAQIAQFRAFLVWLSALADEHCECFSLAFGINAVRWAAGLGWRIFLGLQPGPGV